MIQKYIFLSLLLFVIGNHLLAQKSMYIQIENPDLLPIYTKNNDGFSEFKTKNTYFNSLLNEHKAIFTEVYPNAPLGHKLKDVFYVEYTNDEFAEQILEKFKMQIPLVEILCEPTSTGEDMPNDPHYLQGDQTDMDLINVSKAWHIAKKYPKVKVAITDTYFNETHEDLMYDTIFINNMSGSSIHGTFTAGCLGAINNNGTGIASTGGYNTLLAVSTNWANDMEVVRLAEAGYRVINCSWINSCYHSSLQALTYERICKELNTVVVFGAGNGTGHCGGRKTYPASYEHCLSVTSIGHKNERGVLEDGVARNWKDVHEYNIGDTTSAHHHNNAVDICAPGYRVYSTLRDSYGPSSGTSFAAPQVAGVAAMIIAVNPNLTASEVIDILKSTADSSIYDIPENSRYIGGLGTGRLDAYKAVKKACSVDLSNKLFSSPAMIEGCFISAKNTTISNNTNIVFNATEEIVLDAGFECESGSIFEAIIRD